MGRTIAIKHSWQPRRIFFWIQEGDLQTVSKTVEEINRKLRALCDDNGKKSLPKHFFKTILLPKIPSYLKNSKQAIPSFVDLIPHNFSTSLEDISEILTSSYFQEVGSALCSTIFLGSLSFGGCN